MKILVDADASPVVGITIDTARKYQVAVELFCDTNHLLASDYAAVHIIGAGKDAVDLALINNCAAGDIAIAQDYALAALVLAKKAQAINQNGWLYTGDMAKEDEDGFIYLVDRKKDVIISGGENIYPVQIEDFLHTHEAIKDVAVIGLPDRRLGEIAAAIIECKPGYTLTEEEVNEFCHKLPRYKRPHKIIFADIPRNATGKIEKPKLRKIYCGENLVAAQTRS